MADGYIATVEAKYHYNFWRPITAIRLGDTDGNPHTVGVPDWTPLQPTYPFPTTIAPCGGRRRSGGGPQAGLRHRRHPVHRLQYDSRRGGTCADPAPVLRSYSSFAAGGGRKRSVTDLHRHSLRHAVEEGVPRTEDRRIAVHRLLKPVYWDCQTGLRSRT